MIDSLCRPSRPPTDFRRSSSIPFSRAEIGHGGMGTDRYWGGGNEEVTMFFPPLPLLLIHSLLRRRAGCGAMTPGLVAGCSSKLRGLWCPGIKPPPFFYSDPPMRQIKTRTAPRRSRSWIIPSRAPSQPRSMSRWRRIVFRHPGAAAAAGRLRRESRSPRHRLLDR